jgi:hypothetical protein
MIGESAASLVLRAAVAMSPYPAAVVGRLLGRANYLASTMNRSELADAIAAFAGLAQADVMQTMLRLHEEDAGLLRVGDFVLRPDQIMQTPLRLAPGCLQADLASGTEPYHRLIWAVRSLERDPDTGAPLSGRCSNCRVSIAWENLRELGRCSHCRRPSWVVDQTQAQQPAEAAAFRIALFRSSPFERAEFRRRLPVQTERWPEADILSLLDAVAALHSAPDTGSAADAAASSILGGTDDLIGVMRQRMASYKVPHGWLSIVAAVARLTGDVDRSPSRKTREFLKRLIGAV